MGFPDSCSTTALSGPGARKRRSAYTNTNISIPDTLTTPTLSPSTNSPSSLSRPPRLPPGLPNSRIPHRPLHLPHNNSKSPQIPTKSHGMAIKCSSPFHTRYLSLTPPSPRFNIYILDYCKKRGYRKTANELVSEADISPDSKPPINAQQGLLFEFVPLLSLFQPI